MFNHLFSNIFIRIINRIHVLNVCHICTNNVSNILIYLDKFESNLINIKYIYTILNLIQPTLFIFRKHIETMYKHYLSTIFVHY
jgi:hypothetical protein